MIYKEQQKGSVEPLHKASKDAAAALHAAVGLPLLDTMG